MNAGLEPINFYAINMLVELLPMINFIKSKSPNSYAYFWLITGLLLLTASTATHAKEVTQQYRGMTLNANLELADGKTLKDGVVLILHGMMAHNRMEIIESSQQILLENNRSSLAINLSLGIDNRHGFYDCNWPQTHTSEDSLDELDQWVEWLFKQGVEEIVIMAHSRGANQAMVYMTERKKSVVKHLVLLAPNTVKSAKMQYEGRYGDIFDETIAKAEKLIKAGKGGELIEKIDFSFCPRSTISADTFYSYYAVDDKFRQYQLHLPNMPVPTLIITGTQDERQPDLEEVITPYIDGKQVRLSRVENAGHFFQDFNLEEAVESAVEFITEAQ